MCEETEAVPDEADRTDMYDIVCYVASGSVAYLFKGVRERDYIVTNRIVSCLLWVERVCRCVLSVYICCAPPVEISFVV